MSSATCTLGASRLGKLVAHAFGNDHLAGLELIEQRHRLGRQHDLGLRRRGPDQGRELGDGERMQPELGLVDHDQRRQLGLEQQGRQADKSQRAVGQSIRGEQRIVGSVAPRQLDDVGVDGAGRKDEIVEERRHRAHGLHDASIRPRRSGLLREQKWRQVVTLGAQRAVVVEFAFIGRRRRTGIVEVEPTPALHRGGNGQNDGAPRPMLLHRAQPGLLMAAGAQAFTRYASLVEVADLGQRRSGGWRGPRDLVREH